MVRESTSESNGRSIIRMIGEAGFDHLMRHLEMAAVGCHASTRRLLGCNPQPFFGCQLVPRIEFWCVFANTIFGDKIRSFWHSRRAKLSANQGSGAIARVKIALFLGINGLRGGHSPLREALLQNSAHPERSPRSWNVAQLVNFQRAAADFGTLPSTLRPFERLTAGKLRA